MVRAILLDIEGTTTPISFVHDVLFPYTRLHLRSYLHQNDTSTAVIEDLHLLNEEHSIDEREGLQPPALVEPYVYWLIDRDRKSPALKSLQGKIWEQGYKDGSLRAPVFADVRPALERWNSTGKSVNIFSSGSVLAQKLLFAHTDQGDLTELISNYFDTQVGKKNEKQSYQAIAHTLSLDTKEFLFLSDITAELDAAAEAGMMTALCVRPGNHPQTPKPRHRVIETFDGIVG
jgi:enolase-phosphatase E1